MQSLIFVSETVLSGLLVNIKLIFRSVFSNELLAFAVISITLPPT